MAANSLEALIQVIKRLPDTKQRSVAAILGAIVADTASRPLHWIYDQEMLNDILRTASEPEFWPESKSPYYTIPTGYQSSYSNATYVTLMSMSKNNGKIDMKHICEAFKSHFGPGTDYDDAFRRRNRDPESHEPDVTGPVEGPWIHSAVIEFLENYEQKSTGPYGGENNDDIDGFCAAIPIVAQQSGKTDLWKSVAKISSLLSTNPEMTKLFHVATIVLDGFIQSIADPFKQAKSEVQVLYTDVVEIFTDVEENSSKPFVSTVDKFGKACSLPGVFKGAYMAMLNSSSYVDAVRLNITGGGDNCARANFIGACFGAKYGMDGIPVDWLKKVKDIEKITEMAINIMKE